MIYLKKKKWWQGKVVGVVEAFWTMQMCRCTVIKATICLIYSYILL